MSSMGHLPYCHQTRGVGEIHRCGILHRDLKPENICFENGREDVSFRIIDFGLSVPFRGADGKKVETPHKGFGGTVEFASVNVHNKSGMLV